MFFLHAGSWPSRKGLRSASASKGGAATSASGPGSGALDAPAFAVRSGSSSGAFSAALAAGMISGFVSTAGGFCAATEALGCPVCTAAGGSAALAGAAAGAGELASTFAGSVGVTVGAADAGAAWGLASIGCAAAVLATSLFPAAAGTVAATSLFAATALFVMDVGAGSIGGGALDGDTTGGTKLVWDSYWVGSTTATLGATSAGLA